MDLTLLVRELLTELMSFSEREKFVEAMQTGEVETFTAIKKTSLPEIHVAESQERAKGKVLTY